MKLTTPARPASLRAYARVGALGLEWWGPSDSTSAGRVTDFDVEYKESTAADQAQTARTCIHGHLEERNAVDPAASHLEMGDNVPGRDHELGRPRHAPSVMAALAL